MKKLFCIPAILLFASVAHATGGSCPTGAIQNFGTLASTGVTNCYYIAASGSDSLNDGKSEGAPFLHSPGMANCTANCASATQAAGTGFIFRGGDTWHFGNSGATPYAGIFASTCSTNGTIGAGFCWANGSKSGTQANPIYFGVDLTWFTGGSWTRPIFTADNPLTPNPTVFGDFVASCTYQQMGNANEFVNFSDANWVIFDNIELTGMCQNRTATTSGDDYFSYGATNGDQFLNTYVHGWTHIKFNANGDCGTPTTASSTCFHASIFAGSATSSTAVGETIAYNVVDGADSDPSATGFDFPGFYNTHHNVFRYFGQGVYRLLHVYHDNLMEHVYSPGDLFSHPNLLESDGEYTAAPDAVYNNVFRHVCTDTNACPFSLSGLIFQNAPIGQGEYVFNNLMYNVRNIEYFGLGGTAPSGQGNKYIFNNTWQYDLPDSSGSGIYGCAGAFSLPFQLANNHYITNDGIVGGACVASEISGPINDLTLTNAQATTDGYNSGQIFAYSPPSGGAVTVGAGNNRQAYCTTLLASSDALIQAAGTACQSDTTYAVTYNSSTHTVTGSARTAVARPSIAAWDVGAYQFATNTVSVSPSSLNFGSIDVGVQSPGQGVMVTNSSGVSITFTGVTYSGANGADFSSLSNLCGGTLSSGSSCTITASFKPTLIGSELGQMNIAFTGGSGSPLAVALAGIGIQGITPAPAQTMMSKNLAGCTPQKVTTFCLTADGHIYVSTCGASCSSYVPYGVTSVSVNGGNPAIGNVALTIPSKATTTLQ